MKLIDLHFKDGTLYNPPKNPLYDKYPMCKNGLAYECMWCDKCPLGDKFSPKEEDKEIYDKYEKDFFEYLNNHGGFRNLVFNIKYEKEENNEFKMDSY